MKALTRFQCARCSSIFHLEVDLRMIDPAWTASVALRKARPTDRCKHALELAGPFERIRTSAKDAKVFLTIGMHAVNFSCAHCLRTWELHYPKASTPEDRALARLATLIHHRCGFSVLAGEALESSLSRAHLQRVV